MKKKKDNYTIYGKTLYAIHRKKKWSIKTARPVGILIINVHLAILIQVDIYKKVNVYAMYFMLNKMEFVFMLLETKGYSRI